MAEYSATVSWSRGTQDFLDLRYSRAHTWRFDGGVEVRASSSPHVVPLPMSEVQAVDPEEAFVASLSSCHMLWFLSLAAQRGWRVDSYRDNATGVMRNNPAGKLFVAQITLRPLVKLVQGFTPSFAELRELHQAAHAECFIANSVKTEIRCEPQFEL
jgi:organic hydroperoxide reductase OsmC/OhrA